MKLVITTQYMENYGAHDWDGQSNCPQYWKQKGGSLYVVEGLNKDQALKAVTSNIPTLRGLIEYSDEGSREYVIDLAVVKDSETVWEDWEQPVYLSYENGKWVARETVENDEYGYLNSKIARMIKKWDMLKEGGRENYSAVYILRTGEEVSQDNISKALAA